MVKLVKKVVEVFVDEYTGKEYKTKASAEKAEQNSLLYKKVGFLLLMKSKITC